MSRKLTEAAFWVQLIETPSGCWEWQGSRNNSGYGNASWQGQPCVAHRLAAFLVGMVDTLAAPTDRKGLGFILHDCDNRICCNPDHLYVGTYSDNAYDAYEHGNKKQPRGWRHTNSRLKQGDAQKIRKLCALGHTQVVVGKQFGLSQAAVSLIIRRKTYRCN